MKLQSPTWSERPEPLCPGQTVWIPDRQEEAEGLQEAGTRSYEVQTSDGGVYRRNRRALVEIPNSDSFNPNVMTETNLNTTETNLNESNQNTSDIADQPQRSTRQSQPPNRYEPSWRTWLSLMCVRAFDLVCITCTCLTLVQYKMYEWILGGEMWCMHNVILVSLSRVHAYIVVRLRGWMIKTIYTHEIQEDALRELGLYPRYYGNPWARTHTLQSHLHSMLHFSVMTNPQELQRILNHCWLIW